MAQQVLMPPRQSDTEDYNTILRAISLAKDIYGLKMDSDRQKIIDAKNEEKNEEKIALEKSALEDDKRQERLNIEKDYVPVSKSEYDSYTSGGLKIPVVNRDNLPTGIKLPEESIGMVKSSILAEEKEKNRKLAEVKKTEKDTLKKGEFDRSNKLFDDYTKLSADTRKAVDGYRRVESAARQEPSGPSDLALIFGFMKTIDPGSTVREGEFANAENAQGVPQQVMSQYNKVMQGERLTSESRQKFLTAAKSGILSQLDTQSQVDDQFRQISRKFDVDEKYVINPVFDELRKNLNSGSNGPVSPSSQNFSQQLDTSIPGLKLSPEQALEELKRRQQGQQAGQTAGRP